MHYRTKSLKFRRLEYKWKKFCDRLDNSWLRAKTFAIKKFQKLSRPKSFTNRGQSKVQVGSSVSEAKVLEPSTPSSKIKPKPLGGVKIKYEMLPIKHNG